MVRNLLMHSKSAGILKDFLKKYHSFEDAVDELYEGSYLHGGLQTARDVFKKYMKQSFLWKMTETRKPGIRLNADGTIIDGSIFFVKAKRENIAGYFKRSEIASFINNAKAAFRKDVLGTIGVIVFTASVVNAIIAAVMKVEIDIFGWIMRVAFILLSAAVISADAGLKDVEGSSLFIKLCAGHKNR